MSKFNVVRRMSYPARQMFELASDVASYPQFVPLCKEARVWNKQGDGENTTTCTASLLIVYKKLNLREEFVSEVLADAERLRIRAVSSSGPVKRLENRWRFIDIPDAGHCDVEFSVDFEMKTRPLHFVVSTMFDYAMRKMMTAFEQRAAEIYPK